MGWFARKRHSAAKAKIELTEEMRAVLPPRFEAVGEALADGSASVTEACWVAGRSSAEMGVSLGESLEGLRSATQLVRHRDPTYAESHALSLAWSEATLEYLHGLSCADPLTGLSTMAHLRDRISELYRDSHHDVRGHALVVTQLAMPGLDPLGAARSLTLVGETARSVFSGTEAIGQVGPSRVVIVAPRDEALAGRVALLRRMVTERAERVWIEGLPTSDSSAASLLDELARGA